MTNPGKSGTNADDCVTAATPPTHPWLRRLLAEPAGWAAVAVSMPPVLLIATVNSVSVATDMGRNGIAFRPAEPWIWEFSSAISILLWLLPVLRLDDTLRARVRGFWPRLGVLALASVAFSALHVTTMVALRHLVYGLLGWRYDFGSWVDASVYEYRKDALTFALILGVAAAWRAAVQRERRAVAPPLGEPASPVVTATAPTFLVRTQQGDLLVRADEVDWVEAQGNYVALHVRSDVRLLRQTLAEMEARLKDHGFIRTHRSALVNRLRMQAILPPEHGEPGVRLSSGQVAPLSESRRSEVLRLVLGA